MDDDVRTIADIRRDIQAAIRLGIPVETIMETIARVVGVEPAKEKQHGLSEQDIYR